MEQDILVFLADYFGSFLSLTITLLYARNNIWAWPLCLMVYINGLYLYLTTGIYGKVVLDIIYIILSIYGLWHWRYGGKNHNKLPVTNIPVLEAYVLLGLLIIGYSIVSHILINHTNSTIPRLDALTMMLCLIGQWLTSRKYIESWSFWFMTDCIMAAMFYSKGLTGHFLLNLIYLPIAIYGHNKWLEIKREYNSYSYSGHAVEQLEPRV